jgi:hypothetical protein
MGVRNKDIWSNDGIIKDTLNIALEFIKKKTEIDYKGITQSVNEKLKLEKPIQQQTIKTQLTNLTGKNSKFLKKFKHLKKHTLIDNEVRYKYWSECKEIVLDIINEKKKKKKSHNSKSNRGITSLLDACETEYVNNFTIESDAEASVKKKFEELNNTQEFAEFINCFKSFSPNTVFVIIKS